VTGSERLLFAKVKKVPRGNRRFSRWDSSLAIDVHEIDRVKDTKRERERERERGGRGSKGMRTADERLARRYEERKAYREIRRRTIRREDRGRRGGGRREGRARVSPDKRNF